ncbi:hypothetical protein GJAV_G00169250 [Gymnothorax javanicus]|nr:hypothetical protein GJAV_G00169250 [Gymnothorax javanicus]
MMRRQVLDGRGSILAELVVVPPLELRLSASWRVQCLRESRNALRIFCKEAGNFVNREHIGAFAVPPGPGLCKDEQVLEA